MVSLYMKNSSSNNLILPKYLSLVKKKGSSLALPANGLGGSSATSLLVAHFALQNTASSSAEKKNRPREGVAEGGFCSKNVRISALPPALWFWISFRPSKLRKNTMPRRFAPRLFLTISQKVKIGGEGGIRTLEPFYRLTP